MIPIETEVVRLQNSLAHDLLRFVPELLLVLGIAGSLFAKFFTVFARIPMVRLAIPLVVAAFGITLSDWMTTDLFRGLLRFDGFANLLRAFLLLTAMLALVLARIAGRPDVDDSADFVALVLGATLGMMLMVSANHLLMVFLAIEMASLPSYVLVGFRKGHARASEAALKYVVYGAAASGSLLYGISLIVGRLGTASLSDLATNASIAIIAETFDLPFAAALFLILVGLGYKLAVVPFQFWLPDVFEGATAAVAAILAVASKAAALGLVVRLTFCFTAVQPNPPLREGFAAVFATLAVLSMTIGNLAAYAQSNLHRLLAYSTIAHAGVMLLAVACLQPYAVTALLYYLLGYLPMTIGIFTIAAILRDQTGEATLESSRGLLRRSPALGIAAIVFLFGLLGLPPLAGFAGKFQIFASLFYTADEAVRTPWLAMFLRVAFVIAILNTVVAAGYYLKLIKAIALDEPVTDRPIVVGFAASAFAIVLAAAVLAVGLAWDPLLALINVSTVNLER
ncbi:MAG: NADH-quinone oxidoreductase subunit N [Gemmataceae bacterium]|nr:NADH-quinone oxidoreductase subunit N [Gemmataceae bacterium]